MCVLSRSVVSDSDPMDSSPPGSSIHGIFQARILDWVAIFATSGDLPNLGVEPVSLVSPALAGKFFTTVPPGSPFHRLLLLLLSRVSRVQLCATP